MEQSIYKAKTRKDRVLWLGLFLIIVGTVSFSNYERVGDILILIGAIVIIGSGVWVRLLKSKVKS